MEGEGEFGKKLAGLPVAEGQAAGAVDGPLKYENHLEPVRSGERDDESGKAVDDGPAAGGEIKERQGA